MAEIPEIRQKLEQLLASEISLREFSGWFVPYAWNSHLEGDPLAHEFAEAIDDVLVEFDGDSEELRNELRTVLESIS